jgi:hypothetical protein
MLRRGLQGVGALVTAFAVLAACGASDVKYVKNSDLGVFLKVPHSWTIYDLDTSGPGGYTFGNKAVTTSWSVGFDSSTSPTRSHFDTELTQDPVGVVRVVPSIALDVPKSITGLYAVLSGQTTDEQGQLSAIPANINVLDRSEIEYPSGYWGVQVTKSIAATDGSLTITDVALFDPSLQLVYVLELSCTSACFDQHRDQIDGIVESLRLEKP